MVSELGKPVSLKRHPEGTRKIARVISKLLHPYIYLPLVVALIAYEATPNLVVSIKWTVVGVLPAYLSTFLYLYRQAKVAAVAQTITPQVLYDVSHILRETPNEMSIVTCLFGISSVPLLYFLGSPPSIIATMVGVTITMLLISQVSRIYQASFHLAFLTSIAVSLCIILGLPWLIIAPLIVLLGLSRYHLGKHTPAQLVVGLLISLAATILILNAFGFS